MLHSPSIPKHPEDAVACSAIRLHPMISLTSSVHPKTVGNPILVQLSCSRLVVVDGVKYEALPFYLPWLLPTV